MVTNDTNIARGPWNPPSTPRGPRAETKNGHTTGSETNAARGPQAQSNPLTGPPAHMANRYPTGSNDMGIARKSQPPPDAPRAPRAMLNRNSLSGTPEPLTRGSHAGSRSETNWSLPLGHGKPSPSFVPNRTRIESSRHADASPQPRSRDSAAALDSSSMPPNRSCQAQYRGPNNGESSRSAAVPGGGRTTDRWSGRGPDLQGPINQRNTQSNGHTTEMERTAGSLQGGSRTGGNSNNSFKNPALSIIPRIDESPSNQRTRSNAPMRGVVRGGMRGAMRGAMRGGMRGGMDAGGGYQLNSHAGPSNSGRNIMNAGRRHQENQAIGASSSSRSNTNIGTSVQPFSSLIPGVVEQQGDKKPLLNTSSSSGISNQDQNHASQDPRMSNAYSSIHVQEQQHASQDPPVSNANSSIHVQEQHHTSQYPPVSNAYSSIKSNEPQISVQVQNPQASGYSSGETNLTPHFRLTKFGTSTTRFVVCFCSNPRGYLQGTPTLLVCEEKKGQYEWSQWSSLTTEERARERLRYMLIIYQLEMQQYASHHSEIWHIGEAADRRIVNERIAEIEANSLRDVDMVKRSKEYKLSSEYMGMISPTHLPKHGSVKLDVNKVPMEHWPGLLHLYKDRYVPRTAEQRLPSFDLDKYIAAQTPKEEDEGVAPNDDEKNIDTQPSMVNKGKGKMIDKGKGKEKVAAEEEGEQVEGQSLGGAVVRDIEEEIDVQSSMASKWKGKGKQVDEPRSDIMAPSNIMEDVEAQELTAKKWKGKGKQVEKPVTGDATPADVEDYSTLTDEGRWKEREGPSLQGMVPRDINKKLERIASEMPSRVETKA